MKSNPGRFSALVWWLSAAASGQEARRGLLWLVWLVMASRSRDILIAGGGSAGTAATPRATLSPAQMLGEEKSLSATPRYRWTAPLSSSCSGHVDSPLSGFGAFSWRDRLFHRRLKPLRNRNPESRIKVSTKLPHPRASRAFLIFDCDVKHLNQSPHPFHMAIFLPFLPLTCLSKALGPSPRLCSV